MLYIPWAGLKRIYTYAVWSGDKLFYKGRMAQELIPYKYMLEEELPMFCSPCIN